MAKSLAKHIGTVDLLIPDGYLLRIITLFSKALEFSNRLLYPIVNRQYLVHGIIVAWLYGKIYSRLLRAKAYDLVFAVRATNQIAFLKTATPIVSDSDSTFARLLDYYPAYTRLYGLSRWEGNTVERRAIRNAALRMYNSKWAAESAIRDYDADPRYVTVDVIGPNIHENFLQATQFIQSKPPSETLRLLFVGADWSRKGGAIAYQTMVELNRSGCNTTITICGCDTPPDVLADARVKHVRHLDKGSPAQCSELVSLYKEADWFIVPTRAECMGEVFREACAFGLPSLAPDTGGVRDAVIDGVTGFLMRYDDTGAEYAARIRQCMVTHSYEKLRLAARGFYEQHANWDAWALRLNSRLKQAGLPHNPSLIS